MILRSSGILGLALDDRSITCAELAVGGDRRSVRRMATFTLPPDVSLDQADKTGQMLATFLRQQRFRASRAVVGVPARWLIATERSVPTADQTQVSAILRLHAEQLSVTESGEMVFDYTGRLDPARGGKVLLVGILRQQLERIDSLMEAAGIAIVAVTPTSLALASGMVQEPGQPMLVLNSQNAELVWQHEGTPRLLRHITLTATNGDGMPEIGPLGSELRRTMALAPTNGTGLVRELLLWDGIGLSERRLSDLSNRLEVCILSAEGFALLGIQAGSALDTAKSPFAPAHFAPALALALAGVQRRTLPLDLRRSRLSPPTKRKIGRRAVWAATLGTVVVIAVAALYGSVRLRQGELNQLQTQLDSLAGEIKSAEQMLSHVTYARGFFDARPPMLDCLREITLTFRNDEAIWVTSFNLHENGKGQLTGKATDQKTILQLCDRLQRNSRFADVRTLQMTEVNVAGGRSKEHSFTIGFTFAGME